MPQKAQRIGFLWGLSGLALLSLAAPGALALAEQKVYHSKLVTIFYDNEAQLSEFARKIQPESTTRTLSKVFLGKGPASKKVLGDFLETLFQRIQMILDMPLPGLKVKIIIHKSLDELSRLFAAEFGGPSKKQRQLGASEDVPAFYVKRTNTIHLQTEKLTIGILAHEMAHCVTEHYFVIRPPPKMAEMMSQLVDREISAGRF